METTEILEFPEKTSRKKFANRVMIGLLLLYGLILVLMIPFLKWVHNGSFRENVGIFTGTFLGLLTLWTLQTVWFWQLGSKGDKPGLILLLIQSALIGMVASLFLWTLGDAILELTSMWDSLKPYNVQGWIEWLNNLHFWALALLWGGVYFWMVRRSGQYLATGVWMIILFIVCVAMGAIGVYFAFNPYHGNWNESEAADRMLWRFLAFPVTWLLSFSMHFVYLFFFANSFFNYRRSKMPLH